MSQENISQLIAHYQRRLHRLKEQKAKLEISTPPEILNEIEDIIQDTEGEIQRLKAEASELVRVENERLLTENEDLQKRVTQLETENRALKNYLDPDFVKQHEEILKRFRELLIKRILKTGNGAEIPTESELILMPDTDLINIQKHYNPFSEKIIIGPASIYIGIIIIEKTLPKINDPVWEKSKVTQEIQKVIKDLDRLEKESS